jgi:hypothetical protein
LNWEAIAIILATFLGPIFAVLVTIWREGRSELHKRQTYIFRTLMATRRIAVSREHVDALNLIEVDFYKVAPVQTAYREYLKHLQTRLPDHQAWENTRQDLLAKLLRTLSVAMKMPIGEIDLRNGGYSPGAWEIKDRFENFVGELIAGKNAVPINIVGIPSALPPPPPGPPQGKVPGFNVQPQGTPGHP